MPITKELENLRKFESVGFTHEQAETLTDVIKQSHVNGQQSLKDFINDKFEEFRYCLYDNVQDIVHKIYGHDIVHKVNIWQTCLAVYGLLTKQIAPYTA